MRNILTGLLIILCCVVQTITASAQGVGVNNSSLPPDNSAMLDVSSTDKGVLIPRMTTSQQLNITSPATGLLIFNTDSLAFMYFDGSFWISWCHSPCLPPPPKPIANAGPDATICKGDNTTLTGSCSNCTGSVAYSWTPSGSLSNSTISNPVASPTTTTTYILTVNNGSGIGTDDVVITVIDVPPTPGPISGLTSVCPLQGDIAYSVPVIAGATTYYWFVESGDTIKNGQGTNAIAVNFECIKNLPTRIGVYAENICGFSDTAFLTIQLPPPACNGEIDVTDARDGKVYPLVELGCQCWMKQNMDLGTRINNSVKQSSVAGVWEKYCYSNVAANCDTFGGLYQWHHALQYFDTNFTQPPYPSQGICPAGYHIPTDPEWQVLYSYTDSCVGTYNSAYYNFNLSFGAQPDSNAVGNKLKIAADCYTARGNPIDCGVSGFDALQGGVEMGGAFYLMLGDYGTFWSANRVSKIEANLYQLKSSNPGFGLCCTPTGIFMTDAFSVRCIRD